MCFLLSLKTQVSMWKRRWKIVKARGDGWLEGNGVFQIQQSWCICEFTETTTAYTRPTQVQTRQNPSTEEEKWTHCLTPNKCNCYPLGKRKSFLFNVVSREYQLCFWEGPWPGVIGHSKWTWFFFLCALWFGLDIFCLIDFLFIFTCFSVLIFIFWFFCCVSCFLRKRGMVVKGRKHEVGWEGR